MPDNTKESKNKDFKFKSLKVYASTEWLADNKKKYRQVFYKKDVSFLYIELALINKKFDIENWDIALKLTCYDITKIRKQVCSLTINRQISKYDSTVHIREGWGNKTKSSFWKKGKYVWEARIDDVKIGSKYFYVEDIKEKDEIHPTDYTGVRDLFFYEGSFDDDQQDIRHMTSFDVDETRYIYADVLCKNLLPTQEWIGEFILRYSNEARELKGEIKKIVNVKKGEREFKLTGGWGSNVKGSWRLGTYYLEIIFMEKLLVQTSFFVDNAFREGIPEILSGYDQEPIDQYDENLEHVSSKEVFKTFHSLVGLRDIKKQINDHAAYISFLKLRKENGYKEDNHLHLHSIFSGNPGTGKTTVANLLGTLYRSIGMLKKGHVHTVDRVDLVGEYIGQTAPKVKAAIEKAKGGVLFIDEAYALARNNEENKDFGKEVIEILVKEMGDPKCDFMVIAAGYPAEMEFFVNSNPGLKSRFKQHFEFKDYSLSELFEIVDVVCQKQEVTLSPPARTKVEEIITGDFRDKDEHFGNARYVNDLIEKTKVQMGLRLMSSQNKTAVEDLDLEQIILRDVIAIDDNHQRAIGQLPIDESLLSEALGELDKLIGLEQIKKEINELVEIVRFNKSVGKNPLNSFNLHSVLIGNPGTGKTTVARILAQIFKALGLVEKGHLVEVDRKDLVAGFVGQSALKTAKQIDKAMGGVLFIDEAYSLMNGHVNDFGGEVIQTLLKRMEDDRGKFFVFAAGYTENMKTFLKSNPGLSSRFDKTFEFHDFPAHELKDIAYLILKERGYHLSSKASTALNEYISDVYLRKDKYFGNARIIRNIMLDVIKAQNYRLSKLKDESISNHILKSIVLEDIENMIGNRVTLGLKRKGNIGFAQSN